MAGDRLVIHAGIVIKEKQPFSLGVLKRMVPGAAGPAVRLGESPDMNAVRQDGTHLPRGRVDAIPDSRVLSFAVRPGHVGMTTLMS